MRDNLKPKYKKRIADKKIQEYLSTFGAVCIEGPKWCGKTWTASYNSISEFYVGDPSGNFQNRSLAEIYPDIILRGENPRLIDEWQEVPSIWDAVRYEVDRRGKKGQFILTGSSTPKYKGVLHSGAGRIGRLRMRTMSLYESGCSSGVVSLKELCNGQIYNDLTGQVKLEDIAEYVVRGGWPGNLDSSIRQAMNLSKDYLIALLESDVPKLDGVQYDANKIELLLRSLARNESTTASNNKLLSDIKRDGEKLNAETIAKYLDVLNRLFVLDNQKPFSVAVRSKIRVKQSEKRHFCDPAITCAVLNMTPDKLINDLETFGFMFEALCERDLKIYAESFGAQVYHYQDYSNKEVDAIIELEDGRWCAFEIKLGANQIDKAAESLLDLKNKIAEEGGKVPSVLCVICGLSVAAYKRPDGVFVVPITALKD